MTRPYIFLLLAISYLPAFAGEANVLDVDVSCNSDSICRFDVTVRHDDEGWKHYANRNRHRRIAIGRLKPNGEQVNSCFGFSWVVSRFIGEP